MPDKAYVIAMIREGFRETDHPGDAFLQGSTEGCEPGESVAPFKGVVKWQDVDPAILDSHYTALSFFSEGGFRYFLPAFLIADLEDRLQTADPIFHLTHGFSDKVVRLPAGERTHEKTIGKSEFVNPRRYGAMTWQDHALCKLSVFTREEARAIVVYLEYKRDRDVHGSLRTTSMRRSIASGAIVPPARRSRKPCGRMLRPRGAMCRTFRNYTERNVGNDLACERRDMLHEDHLPHSRNGHRPYFFGSQSRRLAGLLLFPVVR